MRCPKCDWTTVSYEMESGQWRCKRCRAVVKASGLSGWLTSGPARSTPPRSPSKARIAPKPAAKAKPARRAAPAARKPKSGAKTKRPSASSRRGR